MLARTLYNMHGGRWRPTSYSTVCEAEKENQTDAYSYSQVLKEEYCGFLAALRPRANHSEACQPHHPWTLTVSYTQPGSQEANILLHLPEHILHSKGAKE